MSRSSDQKRTVSLRHGVAVRAALALQLILGDDQTWGRKIKDVTTDKMIEQLLRPRTLCR